MIRRSSLWIGSVLLLTSLTAYAGGPPILTTSKVPEYFVVGRAETLVFAVRSMCCHHGLLDHRDFRVRATAHGQRKIEIPAIPTANPGEYTATLTLPGPGDWAITVDFYGCCNDHQSPQLHRRALLPGSRLPDELSLAARGELNFVEKGCITCHIDREVAAPEHDPWGSRQELESILLKNGIPDLTGRTFPREYLLKFLANPSSVRDGARMPNLSLGKDDISALVAFINRERPTIAAERHGWTLRMNMWNNGYSRVKANTWPALQGMHPLVCERQGDKDNALPKFSLEFATRLFIVANLIS